MDAWLTFIALGASSVTAPPQYAPPPPVRSAPWQLPVALQLKAEPDIQPFYSADMRKRGLKAAVEVKLEVSPQGEVIRCEVKTSGVDRALGDVSCRAAQTARYRPSAFGAPVMPLKIVWAPTGSRVIAARPGYPARLASIAGGTPSYPPEAIRQREQGQVTVRVSVSENGRATSCNTVRTSGSLALDQATCDFLMAHGKFENGVDVFGGSLADTVTRSINWIRPDNDTTEEKPAVPSR